MNVNVKVLVVAALLLVGAGVFIGIGLALPDAKPTLPKLALMVTTSDGYTYMLRFRPEDEKRVLANGNLSITNLSVFAAGGNQRFK